MAPHLAIVVCTLLCWEGLCLLGTACCALCLRKICSLQGPDGSLMTQKGAEVLWEKHHSCPSWAIYETEITWEKEPGKWPGIKEVLIKIFISKSRDNKFG